MNDSSMNDILKNFASAGSESPILTDSATGKPKANKALIEKNAMKKLLEGLDSQQSSVNQMPAQHKMAKNTKTKHPAKNFMVGGEHDEERKLSNAEYKKAFPDEYAMGVPPSENARDAKKKVKEADRPDVDASDDEIDQAMDAGEVEQFPKKGKVSVKYSDVMPDKVDEAKDDNFTADDLATLNQITDLPLLKQRAMALISNSHGNAPMKPEKVAWFASAMERKTNAASIIKMMWDLLLAGEGNKVVGSGSTMNKNTYAKAFEDREVKETIMPKTKPKQAMNKKQSLKDMFNSMDEEHENMETRFKRELHDEVANSQLKKGDNGKFDLAENADDAIYDLRAHIQNLAYFATSIDMIGEEMDVNNGETFVALAKKIVKSVSEIRKGRI